MREGGGEAKKSHAKAHGAGGQACAYEAPGMAHGDVDMSDVHGDSAAADDEP